MKKNLLLLFVCLFGALSGVKAWTGQTPTAGTTYYLYNPDLDQFLFADKDQMTAGNDKRHYGVTPSIFNATAVTLESGWKLSFYIDGVKYYFENNGSGGTADLQTSSANYTIDANGSNYRIHRHCESNRDRYLNATASGATCDYARQNFAYRDWQFISVSEMESARSAMAESCASSAASYAMTSSGWERVTSVSDLHTDPENYFFAIFSANAAGLMLQASSNNAESQKLYYKTAVNPASSSQYLFEMENHESGGFALKSCAIGKYFSNADYAWDFHANQTSATSGNYTNLTLTLANGAYTIQTANSTVNYVGLWTLITDWYSTDKYLAGNKQSSLAGSFLIYRIPKQRLRNVDFTQCITNPSFEAEDISAWSCTTGSDTGRKENSDNYVMSNVAGSYLFNTWNNGNASEVSQTLSNMPSGFYTLSAVMASDNNETLRLKVGNDVIATSTATGAGNGIETSGSFSFSGGNMVIKADANNHWYKADNFRLTYIGSMEDLTPVSGKMNIEVNALQITRVTAYNNEKTLENYNAAIAAIEAAEASVASYANITAVYNECNTKAAAKMTTDGQAAFNASMAVSKYNNGTWETSQEATAIAAINSAYITELKLYPNDNTDLTECVTNAAVSEGIDWGTVTNWSSTGEGFHLNNHSTEGNTDGSGMTTPFAEAWVGSGSLGNQDITHDEITGLKSGYYRVTVLTRVYNNANADMGGFKFFANDDETDLRSGATQIRWDANMRGLWKTASVVAEVTDGTLNFGFKVKNASANWLSFKTTTLTYLGETYERPVTIDFTSAIYNPSFEMDYMAAWTYTSGYDTDRKASSSMSGAKGDYLFNTWDWDGKGYAISQTLSNMLPGYYNLSAVMASDNDVALRLMVGEDVVATSTATGATNGVETSGSFYFAGGNMAISADASGSWYKVDDFRLTYVGDASAEMSVKAEVKWATFCAPFDVAIPDGVTAYTCASVTDGKLDMVEVTTGAISANTPVILNAESGLPSTTFYGKKIANATDDLIAGGLLRGNVSASAKDITYTGNEYLLQMQNEKAGFYKMSNSKTYKVGYNRCYLVMDSKQGAREVFFFEDDATAISTLEAAKVEVGALKDGKYLIGNKVVLVKNGVKYSANGQKLN
jgi:hypothetical protein